MPISEPCERLIGPEWLKLEKNMDNMFMGSFVRKIMWYLVARRNTKGNEVNTF